MQFRIVTLILAVIVIANVIKFTLIVALVFFPGKKSEMMKRSANTKLFRTGSTVMCSLNLFI